MKYCRTLVAQGLLADPATKWEITRQRCWEDPPQRIGEPDWRIPRAGVLRLIDTRRGSHNGSLRKPVRAELLTAGPMAVFAGPF